MIKASPHVSKINPYVPGKPIKELERELGIKGSVKLASNENPIGPSKNALQALSEYLLTGMEINRYPDGSGYYLKNAISEKLRNSRNLPLKRDVGIDEIILGNGSNELIDIAVRTFMTHGDSAVMAAPSFVVYSMAVRSVGATPVEAPLIDYRHDLMKMAEAVAENTKMIFIANPNNPTGTINKVHEFERFMEKIPEGVLIVIDEAYYEYVADREYPDTLQYFMNDRDILILRTFSKAYGLAGLRMGYGIARKDIVQEMNRIREPFNTNTVAQLAAIHALGDDEHIKKSIELNERGKAFLYENLESMGVSYVPTEANFIYIPLNNDSSVVYNFLLKEGVIVRPVGPREIRVTIGLPDENKRFIEALKALIKQLSN